jgi:hypothetical protein
MTDSGEVRGPCARWLRHGLHRLWFECGWGHDNHSFSLLEGFASDGDIQFTGGWPLAFC